MTVCTVTVTVTLIVLEPISGLGVEPGLVLTIVDLRHVMYAYMYCMLMPQYKQFWCT